ncbi:hypothetical protein BU23DRAFT_568917 [Bimuria novae-zelandiae CBS 107.79]|uniref:Uncharacterized protein n=1 Tax=Bimuria novae-zelandiae CBS 107.79 TaxID=1447943 RepID=A0A6A5VCH5_9PLEO|nr:hypothetical protein BU23DRAFT_568917 [Bimuria novae-zelandiae CBS 107.79]
MLILASCRSALPYGAMLREAQIIVSTTTLKPRWGTSGAQTSPDQHPQQDPSHPVLTQELWGHILSYVEDDFDLWVNCRHVSRVLHIEAEREFTRVRLPKLRIDTYLTTINDEESPIVNEKSKKMIVRLVRNTSANFRFTLSHVLEQWASLGDYDTNLEIPDLLTHYEITFDWKCLANTFYEEESSMRHFCRAQHWQDSCLTDEDM